MKNLIPLLIVPSLLNIDPVVLEKKTFQNFFIFFFVISFLSPLGKWHVSLFENSWVRFTQGCLLLCLVEIGLVVLEKKFNVFSLFRYLLPFGKWCDPSIKYTWIPFTQEWLLPSLIEIGPWFYRRFLNFVNEFCYFFIIQNCKGCGPSFEQTKIPFTK